MPTPLEICLEETHMPEDGERFIRCVALPGGEPGLALDRAGDVRWLPEAEASGFGLWVSGDEQLILLRGVAAGPITVRRAGRAVEAPPEKPVVLRDQDLLELGGRQLRVHVHGAADEIHPPERLSGSSLARGARATAAAIALSAAVGLGGVAAAGPAAGPEPIEVRTRPPKMVRPSVVCDITSMKAIKGAVLVTARCPKSAPRPAVGGTGMLLDAAGAYVPNGQVVVKEVKGERVVAESKLPKVPSAVKVKLWAP